MLVVVCNCIYNRSNMRRRQSVRGELGSDCKDKKSFSRSDRQTRPVMAALLEFHRNQVSVRPWRQ